MQGINPSVGGPKTSPSLLIAHPMMRKKPGDLGICPPLQLSLEMIPKGDPFSRASQQRYKKTKELRDSHTAPTGFVT